MSQAVLTPADRRLVDGLRSFILTYLAPGLPVVRGLENDVSKPAGSRYAVITPLSAVRQATNLHAYDRQAQTQTITQRTVRRVQLDFYGQGADALAVTCSTLLRDRLAVDFLAAYGVAPLYAGEALAMPEPDGRGKWTKRWTLDAMVQMDGTATVDQPYFDSVHLTLHPQA